MARFPFPSSAPVRRKRGECVRCGEKTKGSRCDECAIHEKALAIARSKASFLCRCRRRMVLSESGYETCGLCRQENPMGL